MRRVTILVAVVLFVLSVYGPLVAIPNFAPVSAHQSTPKTTLQALSGTTPSFQNFQTPLGNYVVVPSPQIANSTDSVTVTIALNPQNNLQNGVDLVSNPNSPDYHAFLANYQVASIYGAAPSSYQSLVSYLTGFGISVIPSGDKLSLTATGTVAQLEQAFNTNIGAFYLQYQSKGMWNPVFGPLSGVNGSTSERAFYANTLPIYLPSNIAGLVSAITGLDGALATPSVMLPLGLYPGVNYTQISPSQNLTAGAGTVVPDSVAANNFAGHYGWLQSPFFFSSGNEQVFFPSTMPALLGAYNLWNGTTTIASQPDQGQGVTVAVVEVGCLAPSVLEQFSNTTFGNPNQVPSRVTQIGVGTGTFQGCVQDGINFGWSLETALDVEYIAAMAPQAHIDIVGAPSAFFSALNSLYPFIGQFLTTGQMCNLPSYAVVEGPTNGACSVTITSNSFGSGETYTAYFGSPMYETVESEVISALALQGVTNFFASGDSGAFFINLESFIPATVPGSTAVGGGSILAGDNGQPFPNTGVQTQLCVESFSFNGQSQCIFSYRLTVADATGINAYTYWSYGFGLGGTFQGAIGGGYGQSNTQAQPWWENAVDTYDSGAAIIPVLSGQADFQMTIYFPEQFCFGSFCFTIGPWNLFFGGTSFATPIEAGQWALVEQQSMYAYSNNKFGDINPLLFNIHNAFNARSISLNPYSPMENIPVPSAFMSTGTQNTYDSYFMDLAYMYPQDQNLPWWFTTMQNPQGSGWNYLQGLGLTNVATLDQVVIGTGAVTDFSLTNPSYVVMEVTPSGLAPFTTLQGGQTYTFQVLRPDGSNASDLQIQAYSGGTYTLEGQSFIPGTVTTITTNNGMFSYAPQYTSQTPSDGASEYGYFAVTSVANTGVSTHKAFAQFAVTQPPASGTLTIGIETPYGLVTSGSAQVPMFTQFDAEGFYTLGSPGVVMLNGQPIAGAVVTQTAVHVDYQFLDPTQPISSFAPGVTIGTWISDLRGQWNVWTDAFLAENNGPVPTQIYTVQASYDGLTSNTITVFVEPQAGFFLQNLSVDTTTNSVVGTVSFTDMRWVNSITICLSGATTPTCASKSYPANIPNPESLGSTMESGVYQDVIPVNFSLASLPANQPVVLNVQAEGMNDLSFVFSFFGFTFVFPNVQNPILWQVAAPVDPAAQVTTTASGGLASGVISLNFQGTGGQGTLTLAGGGSAQTLASGNSGTFSLNTANMPDGLYTATYTVLGAEGTSTTSTAAFFVDNNMLSQLSSLNSEISSLKQQITQLSTTTSSANQQIAQLQSQIASLQSEVQSLQQANVASASTIASLNAQIAQYTQEIQSLKTQLAQSHQTSFGMIAGILGGIGVVSVLGAVVYARKSHPFAMASIRSRFSKKKHIG